MKIISCEEVTDAVLRLPTSPDNIYHDLTGEGKFGFRMACQYMIDKLSDIESLIDENLLMKIEKTEDPEFMKVTYELTFNEMMLLNGVDISQYLLKLFQSAITREKLKHKERMDNETN